MWLWCLWCWQSCYTIQTHINFNCNIYVNGKNLYFPCHHGNPWCCMGEWVDTHLMSHIYPLQVYCLYSCCSCVLSTTSTANLIQPLTLPHALVLCMNKARTTVTAGISILIISMMVVSLQGFAESSKCKMLKWSAVFDKWLWTKLYTSLYISMGLDEGCQITL